MVQFNQSPFNPLTDFLVRNSLVRVAFILFAATLFHFALSYPNQESKDESENPVEIGLARLKNQRSFRFVWRFQRPGVKGEFKGRFHYRDRIEFKGAWHFGEMKEKGEWIASGDEQFEWNAERKEWVVRPRGEETEPLRQMFRILHSPKFEFLRKDRLKRKSCLVYSFEPNAPFLDPSMETELQGELWLNPKTSLPMRVLVFSALDGRIPKSEIYWELLFSDYNKPITIQIPTSRYRLDLKGGMKGVREVLIKRMEGEEFTEVGVKVERGKMRVGFRYPGSPEKIVEHLIAPGILRIHLSQFPKEPVSTLLRKAGDSEFRIPDSELEVPLSPEFLERYGEGALLVFERGDVTKPLILQELLLTEKEVSEASVAFDELSRPILQLVLTKEGRKKLSRGTRDHLNRPIGVILDGRCLSAPILRKSFLGPPNADFMVPGDFTLEEAEGMVLRLRAGPLPHPLKVVALKKL